MNPVEEAKKIILQALNEGRNVLLEPEAKSICKLFGLDVPEFGVAKSEDEAVALAEKLGYPVTMKIVSPDVIHKSDVGGVVVGVKTPEGVREAFRRIMSNVKSRAPHARIYGVFIQKYVPEPIVEVIIGGIRDRQFGPVIMFGLGGIFVEVFKDVTFRIAPIDVEDAYEMIDEVKGSVLLKGYRGMARADVETLAKFIVKVGELMLNLPEISQLDLNPVFVFEKGATVVDARMVVEK